MSPLLALFVGCSPVPPPDIVPGDGVSTEAGPSLATGSTTIVDAGDGERVHLLDADAEAVLTHDPGTGGFSATPLGALPGRIARAADRVWVTLPADRGIAVLREEDGGLVREGTIATGAEPLGIVARADGERVYVALATEGEVHEIDAQGEVVRRWAVEGLPSWLALRPAGDDLYVGSALGGRVTWIDLDTGAVAEVPLPRIEASRSDTTEASELGQRVTGDLSVTPDGHHLLVPMLLTDNRNVPDEEVETTSYSEGREQSVFNPVVTIVTLGSDGLPRDDASLVLTAGEAGRQIVSRRVRSYLSSVAVSPDGSFALATMEASGAVVGVNVQEAYDDGLVDVAKLLFVGTDAGPRGAAFTAAGQLFVDAALDRRVPSVATSTLANYANGAEEVSIGIPRGAELGPSPLDPDVVAGRALFMSAVTESMASEGTGVSCSTCHPAGRTDGLVWHLEDGDRQTPSLAGGIAATAPFTWAYGVASVAHEVEATSQVRMGGEGLTAAQAEQVAAYVESIRAIDVPALDSDDDAVLRGRALFQRADVGCAGCHYGALYTDNDHWPLFGMEAVNTPSLRRVSATPPYLHDGRAETLREVLALSVDGAMGDTSMLSEAELDDLEAYLRSL